MTGTIERDSVQYDIVIVGTGPSSLSATIRLKQLAEKSRREINVCVMEKDSEAGAHSLVGTIVDPISPDELIPDWEEKGAPLTRTVTEDRVLFLTEKEAFNLPVTPNFGNHTSYIVSLGEVVHWLAEQAENLGAEVYPGFTATEVLYHEDGSVKGIAAGNMGVDKDGEPTDSFQPDMELWAQQALFVEGCRGSLSEQVIERFQLDQNSEPQTYDLSIKKIWEVPSEEHRPGLVMHSTGWPLDSRTYDGSFIYHFDDNKVAVGFMVSLDYQNPYLSPFEGFQRFKAHPEIRRAFGGGRRIAYDACSLIEGGLRSLPRPSSKGDVLIDGTAGFLNTPCIKGIHTAMKSAMLAAEAVFPLLENLEEVESFDSGREAADYQQRFEQSWLYQELYTTRNVRLSFKWSVCPGSLHTGIDQMIFRGKTPWILKHRGKGNEQFKKATEYKPIDYPRLNGILIFNRLSSVFLVNLVHEESQPDHLVPKNPQIMIDIDYREYALPETRYCPADAYEIVEENGSPRLQVSAVNCVHCKTCDIKDPTQNVTRICSEGVSGPNYDGMQLTV